MIQEPSALHDLKLNTLAWLRESLPAEKAAQIDIAFTSDSEFIRAAVMAKGLSLKEKTQIEQQLNADLNQKFPLARIRVEFRSSSEAGPAPRPPSKNPFGLQINRKAIPGVRHIVAVASGKGGVGKSTVAANLAVALATRGSKVGLLDADIYGPSVPTMFGVGGPMQVDTERNQLRPLYRHGVALASFGFLGEVEEPVIWRGPLVSKAFEQFCYEVAWNDLDILVLDLPPGTGDIQLTMIERLPLSCAIVVSTPQDVALIDAHKAVSMFHTLQVPILGIVENMAGHQCSRCGHHDDLFGDHVGIEEFCTERGLQHLTAIPLRATIRRNADLGIPIACHESLESKPYYDLAGILMEGLNGSRH